MDKINTYDHISGFKGYHEALTAIDYTKCIIYQTTKDIRKLKQMQAHFQKSINTIQSKKIKIEKTANKTQLVAHHIKS